MYLYTAKIREQRLVFSVQTDHLKEWIAARFPEDRDPGSQTDPAAVHLYISDFYGSMYDDGPVEIQDNEGQIQYLRTDYHMTVSADYGHVELKVFDDLALKHALITWYSAWLIHRRKGLLIHSSCVVEDGKAWLFVGHSGAGKSTVTELSAPRPVLSDEATLLLFGEDGQILIQDSPLRSENEERSGIECVPLGGIHFLIQSPEIRRVQLPKVDTLIGLMDKVFYWKHSKLETGKMIAACRAVVEQVPAYNLYFQKNDAFWGQIS